MGRNVHRAAQRQAKAPALPGRTGASACHGAKRRSGQATIEYAILYAGVILPLTFAIVFAAEMLWVWHSVVDFTRDGARYATTHCWTANGDNVMTYMRTHVPRMIDMDQFQQGQAELAVRYYSRDPDTGSLVDFACDGRHRTCLQLRIPPLRQFPRPARRSHPGFPYVAAHGERRMRPRAGYLSTVRILCPSSS